MRTAAITDRDGKVHAFQGQDNQAIADQIIDAWLDGDIDSVEGAAIFYDKGAVRCMEAMGKIAEKQKAIQGAAAMHLISEAARAQELIPIEELDNRR